MSISYLKRPNKSENPPSYNVSKRISHELLKFRVVREKWVCHWEAYCFLIFCFCLSRNIFLLGFTDMHARVFSFLFNVKSSFPVCFSYDKCYLDASRSYLVAGGTVDSSWLDVAAGHFSVFVSRSKIYCKGNRAVIWGNNDRRGRCVLLKCVYVTGSQILLAPQTMWSGSHHSHSAWEVQDGIPHV